MKHNEYMSSLLFLVSSLVLAVIMFLSISSVRISNLVIIVSIIFSLAADIFFLYRIRNLADEMELEQEVRESALRQKERIASYLAIQKETEQLITEVHDVENSIYEYHSLKNKSLNDEAEAYIRNLKESYRKL